MSYVTGFFSFFRGVKGSWLWLGFSMTLFFFGCKGAGLKQDQAIADLGIRDAMAASDTTVIIEGCGNQPIVGYTYCRVTEGDSSEKKIKISAPPAQCRPVDSSCVDYVIFTPDGREIGGQVPRGQTSFQVSFKDLTGKETLTPSDRGFYIVVLTVRWVDDQGRDRVSQAEGEVRLRVLRQGYRALNDVSQNQFYVWNWNEGTQFYRMTTALRSYVGTR